MRGKTKSDEYLFHPPQPVRAAFWATECVLLTRKTRAAVIGPGYGP
ncbi:hypothetical protein OOU_Y34scaffold00427g5 [Pyricularia oryzae Y34]|uniref:Uncharacterized protein n=1 Tax=Pyricularia oryzae (strain Y34) TaxID=1143189 RepID=A0AA97PN04_PYRO3|nr:hypothetical protein OOU_Y34scaffold00427g5 [Pyricularia oryzae Y34]